MAKKRLTAITLLMFTTLCVCAQRSYFAKLRADDSGRKIVSAYSDSLKIFKASQDTSLYYNGALIMDGRFASLFVPMTFYNSIAKNQMSIDADKSLSTSDELIDAALLNIYLNRPDLVISDERNLNEEREKGIKETTSAIEFHPDMVKKIAPKPVEPDATPIDNIVITKPDFWTFSCDSYLQFLQNYISSNWYKGGENNYSLAGSLILQDNYNNKQKVKWDNKLELKLGFQTSKSDSLHAFKTSEDLIRYTGKIGLQATKKWYYTFQLIAATQFMRSYGTNSNNVNSDFLSPFTLNASIGMDYNIKMLNNSLTGTIHMAPIAYNLKYVGRAALATNYGIDEGRHAKNDFGSEITVDFTWKFRNNISWKSRLYAYTAYNRTEIDMENTFTFQLTSLLSAKLFVYPRFDDSRIRDDHHGYFEFKEYSSIGFSYSF